MHILVPTKQVPDLVEELFLDDDGTALDPDECDYKLNEFDDQSLEEALLLKEQSGGTVTVLALDGDGVNKVLYTALAKGADRAIKLTGPEYTDVQGNLPLAKLYAAAMKRLDYDLVLTGVQGVDDRDGQLGPLLGALLGLPCVCVATGIEADGDTVALHKEYAGGLMASLRVTPPAVLGIQAARQTPRYVAVSKVRQVQQTATLEELEVDDPTPPLSKVLAMAPPETGGGATTLADVDALADVLRDKGVI